MLTFNRTRWFRFHIASAGIVLLVAPICAPAHSGAYQMDQADIYMIQFHPAPVRPHIPTTPTTPHIPSTPRLDPPLRIDPSPRLDPQLEPPTRLNPSPPPPPSLSPSVRIPPGCLVTSTTASLGSDCDARYITYSNLYKELYSCNTGKCYSMKFLELNRMPVIVVLPESYEQQEEALQQLRAEMVYGVKKMGAYLKTQASNGVSDLPSIDKLGSLVDSAVSEIRNIGQPVGETREERRRRLGLGPAVTSLAKKVRDF